MRKLIVLALVSSVASARAESRSGRYAIPSVTEVRSDRATGYRAIVIVSRGSSALIIDRVSSGRISDQHHLQHVKVGDSRVRLASLGPITLVGWHRGVLELEAGDYTCRVSTGDRVIGRCTLPRAAHRSRDPQHNSAATKRTHEVTAAVTVHDLSD
jgi:hypothetical protein